VTRRLVVTLLPILAACNPTVRVATPEPLKVDVDMRVDIYQHATGDAPANGPDSEAQDRRRARMAEIQNMKNARIAGENRRGLLSLVQAPAGEYGDYVRRTVEAENADRLALMKQLAAERRVPLAQVETEQAELWRDRAFPGEWIETQVDGTWRWQQKAATASDAATPGETP
jgi:uncharacterized protein YdbL (DUF1318 family)